MNISTKAKNEIKKILESGTREEIKSLFVFDNENDERILFNFNLWARYHFPKYFTSKDALFHKEIDGYNLRAYKGKFTFIDIAFRGAAKRQPLDAKILTPKGFVKMGELNVGDYVIGSNGEPTRIEYISPIIDRPIYEVKTEDGRKTECDSDHLWTIRKMSNVKTKNVTIDTQKMMDDGLFYSRTDSRYPNKQYKEYKFALDTVKPILFNEKDYAIDPYTLGVLIGDGSFNRKYGSARLTCHNDDLSHYVGMIKGYEIGNKCIDKRNSNVVTVGIVGIGKEILKMGLSVHGNNKFIPKEYLFGSIEQRKALLEGLMDTDGTVSKKTPVFCTVSEKLADGVVDLVRSLGGRAKKSFNKNNHSNYYRVSMLFKDYKPFKLKRKLEKCGFGKKTWSRIVEINLVGNKLGRCIKVENEDGLYVTDDYMLTHNTARTKLFIAFCIANDLKVRRKYFKVLSQDGTNSKQIVTDIYNILITTDPFLFSKGNNKREETMSAFTTSTGVKILADTVGTNQRGALQEESRPDFIWFEDFEDRTTLRSSVKTKAIWDNMEEARTSLSVDGSCVYTCNYVSEAGNVHKLVSKGDREDRKVLIIPIINKEGVIAWDRYTKEDIDRMREDDDDFEGERLCEPSASKEVLFERDALNRQEPINPIKESAGFKIFKEFDPTHEYAGGHDVGGGVGLDSSTSVYIDFSTIPAQVVATYKSNTIKPEAFGYEIQRQGDMYGECLECVERNYGSEAILVLKQQGVPQYEEVKDDTKIKEQKAREYGWHTNALTKPKMMLALSKAIKDGLLILNDPDIISEAKSYTRNDLIENVKDPRLTTRHFDLLIATAIAWQMKDHRLPSVNKSIQAQKQTKVKRKQYQSMSKYGG